jgi:hypothetical protein
MSDKIVIRDPEDIIIKAVKDENPTNLNKTRLYLDVDGTLVAMEFDPNFMANPDSPWVSQYRTDFCH